MNVLIIVGHPRLGSFCSSIADKYCEALARSGRHTVSRVDLAAIMFDPHLHFPSPSMQELEPDLFATKTKLMAADHVVFIFPTWWGTMPAILKGFLDRVLIPGEAFVEDRGEYRGLLKNKTGELITTMDAPSWVYRFIYRAPGLRAMKIAVLQFCGFTRVRATRFARVKHVGAREREKYLEQAAHLGSSAAEWRNRMLGVAAALNWIKAIRLQFYPMTLIAFAVGALLAATQNHGFNGASFWLSYVTLFLIEVAAVFANEVVDFESDRKNRNFGPFTGGSRVLVEGALTRGQLTRGAFAAMIIAAATGVAASLSGDKPLGLAALFGVSAVLGLGYTVAPLRLVYRTLGEINVAFTHSLLMVAAGALSQPGRVPWKLVLFTSTPMFLAVFSAITLAGIPDHDADAQARKHTVAVAFGIGPSGVIAALACFLAAVSMTVFAVGSHYPAIAPFVIAAIWCHCALIVYLIRTQVRWCQRIDSLLALALCFILWFCVPQLAALLEHA